jgi:WD40 repeat protein
LAVAFSPDGAPLAAGHPTETVRLWDVTAGQEVAGPPQNDAGLVWGVAFSPDATLLATAHFDGVARVWSVRTNKLRAPLKHEGHPLKGVTFSPDGEWLAAVVDDTSAHLLRRAVLAHPVVIRSGTRRVDGSHCLRCVQLRRPTTRHQQRGRNGDCLGMVDRPGSERLEASRPRALGRIRGGRPQPRNRESRWDASVWDVAGGSDIRTLLHENAVNDVAFSPDGRLLATASSDASACLWRGAVPR